MSTETVRVGVVGAGANTRERHIPGLQAIEGVEVISVCNRRPDSSEQAVARFGIPRIYRHWWELVAADDSDAIVIGTWPNLHARVTLAALAAGKHVLCEARMARDLSEAREMLEASQTQPQLVAQVVPSPYTLGVDATVKRLLAEGFLGEVLAIEVSEKGAFLDREAPLHWRQNADISGKNIMGMGIWYEAIVRWVGEATRVVGKGRTAVRMRRDPETGRSRVVGVPDHLDIVAEMACGAQAHFGLSRLSGLAPGLEISLYGSDGTLQVRDGRLFGARRGADRLEEVPIPPSEVGGWRVEEEFVAAIRGEEPIRLTTFEDGVKYMAFTEAVHRSMAERREVALASLT